MTSTAYASGIFDTVLSVFSVFFVPDMKSLAAELWRLVRPGGCLAVTVWGPDAFHPLARLFSEELNIVRAEARELVRPWERLTEPENLRALLRQAGAPEVAIEVSNDIQPFTQPEDAWTLIMGAGYRWEVEQLNQAQRAELRERVVRRVSDEWVEAVNTPALHATARKPA